MVSLSNDLLLLASILFSYTPIDTEYGTLGSHWVLAYIIAVSLSVVICLRLFQIRRRRGGLTRDLSARGTELIKKYRRLK